MNAQIMRETAERERRAKKSGLFFSATMLAIVLVSLVFSVTVTVASGGDGEAAAAITGGDLYKYLSYTAAPAAIAAVLAAFVATGKEKFSDACLLSGGAFRPRHIFLSVLLFAGMFFGLSGLNGYFVSFLEKYTPYKYVPIVLPAGGPHKVALTVLTVCVLPAVAEELAFRGFILGGLRDSGRISVALYTGALFALFHGNPAQTPYQFACGFSFALLATDSGSVFPSVAIHFANNFLIVLFDALGVDLFGAGAAANAAMTAFGAACYVSFVVMTLYKYGKKRPEAAAKGEVIASLKYASAGLVICAVLWISAFFA